MLVQISGCNLHRDAKGDIPAVIFSVLPHTVELPGLRIPEHRETRKRIVATESGLAVAPLGTPAAAGHVQLKGDIRYGPVHATLAEGVGVAIGLSGLKPLHQPRITGE